MVGRGGQNMRNGNGWVGWAVTIGIVLVVNLLSYVFHWGFWLY